MGNNQRFPRRFSLARRPGAYLRIIEAGQAQAGDAIEVLSRPAHAVTVRDVATITYDAKDRAAELLHAPELPEMYREWARKLLER
jgi:MOSC domain-containing protein YiiM